MKKLILASASPRRKELLEQIGAEFEIIPAKGEEIITKEAPDEVVMELALQKAQEVAQRQETVTGQSEYLVLGADTVVAYDGRILGKPKDEKDAVQMLTMLSGNTHSVYTGVAMIRKKGEQEEVYNFYEETKVTMYPMSKEEIAAYVATGESMDKAGSHIWNTDKQRHYWEGKAGGYGMQDPFGMKYIRRIEGDYYNVVGLPVSRLWHELKKFGIDM